MEGGWENYQSKQELGLGRKPAANPGPLSNLHFQSVGFESRKTPPPGRGVFEEWRHNWPGALPGIPRSGRSLNSPLLPGWHATATRGPRRAQAGPPLWSGGNGRAFPGGPSVAHTLVC